MTALLIASLIRPFALATAAWLLLHLFRIRHPASRHAVWTAVLAGMLLLPPLTLIAPPWTLRILPSKTPVAAAIVSEPATTPQNSELFNTTETQTPGERAQSPQFHWPTIRTLAIWLYIAGFLAMLAYRLMAWRILRGIIARSTRIHRFLRQSNDVLTPVTCGVLQPSILLPKDWRNWPTETRRAALAHEYAHIRRRDTLTLALTRLATCVYWFHPLAWWHSRQISDLAELSCDAAVLEKSGNPGAYSRILLDFAAKITEAGRRTPVPGMAIASAEGMNRRIDRIFELSRGNLRKLSRPGILLALLGLPLTCLIAAVTLDSPAAPQQLHLDIPRFTPPAPPLIAQMQAQPVPPRAMQPAPQSPTTVPLAFDAASVKPIKGYSAGAGGRSGPLAGPALDYQPGRVAASLPFGTTALRLIMEAYHVTAQQVSGGPDWLSSDRFEIEAKATDAGAGKDQIRQMLQKLLIDRFKLAIGRTTRTLPVYALVAAKNGPKLHEIRDGETLPDSIKELAALGLMPPNRPGERFAGFMRGHETMDEFAAKLSDNPMFNDRPVLNKTGLTGVYLTNMLWYEGDVTTAMEEQLGLKLESQKDPVEVITIDHIEKPDPN